MVHNNQTIRNPQRKEVNTMISKRAGFTLIELLVVIAIIAILAAILFPVFAKARQKAHQTSCLSNVKQLMLAFNQYDTDWGFLPRSTGWPGWSWKNDPKWNVTRGDWAAQLYPYVKNSEIFACPMNKDSWNAPTTVHADYNPAGWVGPFDYAYNGQLEQRKTSTFEHVARTLVMIDCNLPHFYDWFHLYTPDGGCCTTGDSCDPAVWWGLPGGDDDCYGAWPHNEGFNIGLADGHAKWYRVPLACGDPIADLIVTPARHIGE